jgi:hypothetical protein
LQDGSGEESFGDEAGVFASVQEIYLSFDYSNFSVGFPNTINHPAPGENNEKLNNCDGSSARYLGIYLQ